MKTYITLLRAVNVSGVNKIKMKDLAELFQGLGFQNVRTYIQSGNVVFETRSSKISELDKKIEEEIQKVFKLNISSITLEKKDLEKIIQSNPFRKKEEKALYVMFMKEAPSIDLKEVLDPVKDKSEEYILSGKYLYLYFPNGYGKTKLSNPFIERKLKVIATTRNWNTLNALVLFP
ncbi:DUF1697 domain-containing protein [Leptospira sp. SA-E8]|uniref:DUF1697 domain-containing protein n=1 Tax=Leptospira sp. SA-E8 TaxID=3422259 RepID=UPI003EBF0242